MAWRRKEFDSPRVHTSFRKAELRVARPHRGVSRVAHRAKWDILLNCKFLPTQKHQILSFSIYLRNDAGLTGVPFLRTSKWRCVPVERPVDPILPIT